MTAASKGEAMSQAPQPDLPDLLRAERESLRRHWFWLLILGVLLIIVGLVAISSAFVATLATMFALGTLLLIGGGVAIANAIWARRWRGFWLHLLAGLLYIVVGMLVVDDPVRAADVITLLLAVSFLVGGVFRIVLALSERFHGWGWVLLNGIVTFVLGLIIWRQWPLSGLWVIGLFVGIDMVFAGWSLVMAALAVRSLAAPPA
jgi:uncharacterized membrane protein HdeD (DUF308 family)